MNARDLEKLANDLEENSFEEFYPEMKIFNDTENISFSGSGVIRINHNGLFEIILMLTPSCDNLELIHKLIKLVNSQKDDKKKAIGDFFMSTNTWKSRPLSVSYHHSIMKKHTYIIRATTDELYQDFEPENGLDSVMYVMPYTLDFPKSEITQKKEWTGDNEPLASLIYDKASFQNNNCEGMLYYKNKYTIFEFCLQKHVLLENFEQKAMAALEFFLGRQISWCIKILYTQCKKSVIIKPNFAVVFDPCPPALFREPPETKNGWNTLFLKYFDFICQNDLALDNINIHSIWLNCISIRNMKRHREYALSLSIAIEQIIRKFYGVKQLRSEQFLELISSLEHSIKSNENCNDSEKELIKNHLKRLIGGDKPIKTILHHLEEKCVIMKMSAKKWENIRNSLTHGSHLDINMEKIYDIGFLQTCLNLLIFDLVKYDGSFIHYGKNDFPLYCKIADEFIDLDEKQIEVFLKAYNKQL